ncbi:MAG: diguanylate cyclase [Burkholderiales bacterium]|nr:diguanylate cyclase [Burkholderiales bacterium]
MAGPLNSAPARGLRRFADVNLAIGLFSALLIAGLWLYIVTKHQNEYRETVSAAFRQSSNLAIAYEEHIARTIKGLDSALQFVRHEYRRLGRDMDMARYIAEGVIDAQLFTILSVVDGNGDIVLSSRPFEPTNYADREFFKAHRDGSADMLHINRPVLGRVSGTWQVPMSRRLDKPDGSFGGVVVLSVDPGYFARFYQKSDIGALGLVTLVGLDGIVRARRVGNDLSFDVDMTGSSLLNQRALQAHGQFLSLGGFDDIQRYVSYRTLSEYPLIVAVGAAQPEVLREYRRNSRRDYAMALLVSLVIAGFAALLMVTLARQKRAREALALSEARYRGAFEQAAIGMAHTSLDRRFIQVNQRFCDMLGYTREELLGRPAAGFTHAEDSRRATEERQQLLSGLADSLSAEMRYVRKDGSLLWVNRTISLVRDGEGHPLYFLRIVEDITERRKLEAELRELAATDMLTGIPNRRAFIARLEEEHARIRRFPQQQAAVLMLDLDNFKKINDTHGHPAGDSVLRHVAELISTRIRAVDACGRLGGEEFSILLTGAALPAAAEFADRLRRAIAGSPTLHEGLSLAVTVSVGIAALRAEDEGADAALLRADRALYRAKESGRDRIEVDDVTQQPRPAAGSA